MFIGRRTRIKDVIKGWKCSRLADIDKALKLKSYADPKQKLPQHYHDFLYVFNRKAAETSPPFRGKSHPNAEKWKNEASLEWEILLRKETLEPIFPHQLDEGFESKKQLHTKTIPLEWVSHKLDDNGNISKFKARICVHGDLKPNKNILKDTRAVTLAIRVLGSLWH